MDLDFLSNLFKGQGGGGPLTALLPLILGGKTSDLSSLLGSFGMGKDAVKQNDPFPPLFSEQASKQTPSADNMIGLLKGLLPSAPTPPASSQPATEYPYELQYNRPYKSKTNEL